MSLPLGTRGAQIIHRHYPPNRLVCMCVAGGTGQWERWAPPLPVPHQPRLVHPCPTLASWFPFVRLFREMQAITRGSRRTIPSTSCGNPCPKRPCRWVCAMVSLTLHEHKPVRCHTRPWLNQPETGACCVHGLLRLGCVRHGLELHPRHENVCKLLPGQSK